MEKKIKRETAVVAEILTASNDIPGLVLYKNPVGVAAIRDHSGVINRYVTYGLKFGSADLIGRYSMMEVPGFRKRAVFVSIETKRPKNGRVTPEQIHWRDSVLDAGGIAMITNSVDEFKWVFEDPDKIFYRVRELAR